MLKGDTPAQNRINKEQFEAMCGIQCTEKEIASIFCVDEDTLNTWCKKTYGGTFSDTYKIYSSTGKMSLRRVMFKQAEKNPTMAIWLSKQHLGMKDKVEYTDDGLNEINKHISNIAELLNNPKPNRSEEDV